MRRAESGRKPRANGVDAYQVQCICAMIIRWACSIKAGAIRESGELVQKQSIIRVGKMNAQHSSGVKNRRFHAGLHSMEALRRRTGSSTRTGHRRMQELVRQSSVRPWPRLC